MTGNQSGRRAPGRPPSAGMTWVTGGSFLMGSEAFYPEERPVRRVEVDGFWMDDHPVTVAEFGSLVFHQTDGPVDLRDVTQWWRYVPGAQWRHPRGPGSGIKRLGEHPVTHVAAEDAEAYAAWAGKQLPSEAEWEFAARGGLDGAVFTWGDDFTPGGTMMANTWQGEFPWQNLRTDGWEGTSPVKTFPANGYGLFDMAGNVWEWTSDYYTRRPAGHVQHACCAPRNPRVTSAEASLDPSGPGGHIPRRVTKGGSHLCAPNYCLRYRPAARQAEAVDTSTCHVGFRCILRVAIAPRMEKPAGTAATSSR